MSLVSSPSSSSSPCSWCPGTYTYHHSGFPLSCLQKKDPNLTSHLPFSHSMFYVCDPFNIFPGRPPCLQLRLCCVVLIKPKWRCSQGGIIIKVLECFKNIVFFSGNENQWQTFQGFTSEQHPAPVSLCLSLQLPRLPHHRCLHHRQHRLISASHFSGATVIAFQIKLLGIAFLPF